VSIRAYTKNDLSAIFEIYNHSKLDELKLENTVFTLLPLEKDKARYSGLIESKIYVYQAQDKVSGFCAIYGNEIRALFVHPDSRGKGIGKKLMEFLLSNTQGQSCLYIASSNQPAKELYQQYGFTITDTFETTYNQMPVLAQRMVRKNSV